jgi:hypothetical protein
MSAASRVEPNRDRVIYRGTKIRMDDAMICLTNLWKATGSNRNRIANTWLKSKRAGSVISLTTTLLCQSDKGMVVVTQHGGNGTAWAHWMVGLAYAEYLSSESGHANTGFRLSRAISAIDDEQNRQEVFNGKFRRILTNERCSTVVQEYKREQLHNSK